VVVSINHVLQSTLIIMAHSTTKAHVGQQKQQQHSGVLLLARTLQEGSLSTRVYLLYAKGEHMP
jgi:hypothetical protein